MSKTSSSMKTIASEISEAEALLEKLEKIYLGKETNSQKRPQQDGFQRTSEKTCPLDDLKTGSSTKKNARLVRSVVEKIQTKIHNHQDVLITFSRYGTWQNYGKVNIEYLKGIDHLKQEIVPLKSWNQAICACQKEKEEEESEKKMWKAIKSKIENRQSFAVLFNKDKEASIFELTTADVNWLVYTINEKKLAFDISTTLVRNQCATMDRIVMIIFLITVAYIFLGTLSSIQ